MRQINLVVVDITSSNTLVPKNLFRNFDFPEEIAPVIGI